MEAYLEGDGGFRLNRGNCGWKERATAVCVTDGRVERGRKSPEVMKQTRGDALI